MGLEIVATGQNEGDRRQPHTRYQATQPHRRLHVALLVGKPQRSSRFHGMAIPAAVAIMAQAWTPSPSQSAPPAGRRVGPETCEAGPAEAAGLNLAGMRSLSFAPFGRPETGWEVYAPLIAHEIGTRCGPQTPAFAGALATWQSAHVIAPTGVVDPKTFTALRAIWQGRRPFVPASRRACPEPPAEASLATVPAGLSYGGKVMQLRARALAAYEAMRAAARAEDPRIGADGRLMTLFSAYRSPDYDAARCVREGNCQGVVRASCSAHRTGLAMDLYLGAAPGFPPDSSADANRLFITRGPAYRWMVVNASRFGFVNYPFEPWHWEWTGEPI